MSPSLSDRTSKSATAPVHSARAGEGFVVRPREPAPGLTDDPTQPEVDAAREEQERTAKHTMPDDPEGDFA